MDLMPFTVRSDAENFLTENIENMAKKRTLRYGIWINQEFAGTICLYAIVWHQKRASIGYALKEDFWNRGIMTRALQSIQREATGIGLNRIQATVLSGNLISKRVLKNAGFAFEGVLREYEFWPNKGYVDLEMYSKVGIAR